MKVIEHLGVKTVRGKEVSMSIGECNSCGSVHEVTTDHLLRKSNDRCKTCRKETHSLSRHPLYSVWYAMVRRCYNPDDKHYKNYGAKGVTVCDSWRHSVKDFVDWGMANGYEKGLTIDKDMKSGDMKVYSPETCQFVTNSMNCRATRKIRSNNTSGFRGICFRKADQLWVAEIETDCKRTYIGAYSTAEQAAKAYDSYVLDNNLEHIINDILAEGERVLSNAGGLRRDNKSGCLGVSWNGESGKWVANITVEGKRIYLGAFKDLEDAKQARQAAEIKYNFKEKQ